LEFRLMTQFTSFVAVEEITVDDGGMLRRIDVPVDVPEGMDSRTLRASGGQTGLFTLYAQQSAQAYAFGGSPPPAAIKSGGFIPAGRARGAGGSGSGSGKNMGGGIPGPPNAPPAVSVITSLPASTEEERVARLRAKLQPQILTLVLSLDQKQLAEIVNYGGFVRERKAEVQLWLMDKSELSKAKLKELGFEVVIDHASSNLMIGRIPVDKLPLLADLGFVRYVSPQISR